jgi:hypothetical protein
LLPVFAAGGPSLAVLAAEVPAALAQAVGQVPRAAVASEQAVAG